MILQTDERLNESINKYGCYFMSILFLANKFKGVKLSTVSILRYWRECIDKGYMLENDELHSFIVSAEKIFLHLGLKVKYTNKHEASDRNCSKQEIEILCLQNNRGLKHFVVGDGKGHIAYNPMGRDNPTYSVRSKRIFKLG